ncbi:MAG: hypothetical protein LBR53_02600 [Deltaproteobacteria bacterium]|jgi:hypothetical protein|nr:hypothetical protein [Deltaproteobacteria bacterium]
MPRFLQSLEAFVRAAALLALVFILPPSTGLKAEGGSASEGEGVVSTYQLGDVLVTYFAPEGMRNLWGLNPDADDFFRAMNPRFKLVVLGAYGNPEEFLEFVRGLKAGEKAKLPKIAILSTTRSMPEKSYAGERAKRQFTKYARWFGAATTTRIVAFGFEVKANSYLKSKLGVDLDFSYDLKKATGVFDRGPGSLSVGVLAKFLLNGGRGDNYLNTTALQIRDKLVFLSMIVPDHSDARVRDLNGELLRWRDRVAGANPAPDTGESSEKGV